MTEPIVPKGHFAPATLSEKSITTIKHLLNIAVEGDMLPPGEAQTALTILKLNPLYLVKVLQQRAVHMKSLFEELASTDRRMGIMIEQLETQANQLNTACIAHEGWAAKLAQSPPSTPEDPFDTITKL